MFDRSFTHGIFHLSNARGRQFVCACVVLAFCCLLVTKARAQSFEKELSAPEKVTVTIRNAGGRVTVEASDEAEKKIYI